MSLLRRVLLATLALVGLCAFLTGCWWLGGCKFNGGPGQVMLGFNCAIFGPFAFVVVMATTMREE